MFLADVQKNVFEYSGQVHRFFPEFPHGGLIEEVQCGSVCCHRQYGCIGQLPGFGRLHGLKDFVHKETAFVVVSPPAFETRYVPDIVVALMDEDPCHTPRTAVQIFVAAPSGHIHTPIVQGERHIACSVCQVPAHHGSFCFQRLGDALHIK